MSKTYTKVQNQWKNLGAAMGHWDSILSKENSLITDKAYHLTLAYWKRHRTVLLHDEELRWVGMVGAPFRLWQRVIRVADRAELPVTVSPELPVDSSPAAELTAHLLDPLRHTPLCAPEQSTISYRTLLFSHIFCKSSLRFLTRLWMVVETTFWGNLKKNYFQSGGAQKLFLIELL